MQVSSLYRRGVILPLNEESEECLRSNEVDEMTLVRFLKIPDQASFEAIWETGLFQRINANCGTLLDDYEEDIIMPSSFRSMHDSIKEVRNAVPPTIGVEDFLNALEALAAEAHNLNRPLLFVL